MCAFLVSHPCLVSHQCRCVLQRLVWLTLCILAYRLFATTCKHPCLKPLGTHAKASLPLYERSVGFASCKAFGRSFQASLPCLLLPLHRTSLFPQPLQKDNNPSPHTQPSQNRTIPRKPPTPLPPLSKGGGLTARHKLSLCCIFTCDTSAFFIHQTFCRQDGGIALRPPTSPSPQPSQKHINRFAPHHILAI